jgi:hypothetical protein
MGVMNARVIRIAQNAMGMDCSAIAARSMESQCVMSGEIPLVPFVPGRCSIAKNYAFLQIRWPPKGTALGFATPTTTVRLVLSVGCQMVHFYTMTRLKRANGFVCGPRASTRALGLTPMGPMTTRVVRRSIRVSLGQPPITVKNPRLRDVGAQIPCRLLHRC